MEGNGVLLGENKPTTTSMGLAYGSTIGIEIATLISDRSC